MEEINSTTELSNELTDATKGSIKWFMTLFIVRYLGLIANGKFTNVTTNMTLVFSHISGWIVSIFLVIKDYYKEKNSII